MVKRHDSSEERAHAGVVETGDFVFVGHCVNNSGQPAEQQANGAFGHLCRRPELAGLTPDPVVT